MKKAVDCEKKCFGRRVFLTSLIQVETYKIVVKLQY